MKTTPKQLVDVYTVGLFGVILGQPMMDVPLSEAEKFVHDRTRHNLGNGIERTYAIVDAWDRTNIIKGSITEADITAFKSKPSGRPLGNDYIGQ